MTARAITPTQAAVLGFIVRRVRDLGYPPTLREICAWAGWTGKNAAAGVLVGLERAGYVSVDAQRARGIRVLRTDVLIRAPRPGEPSSVLLAQARDVTGSSTSPDPASRPAAAPR